MQAFYGYFTTMESLKEVSRSALEDIHALDPAKHDFSDKPAFDARQKLAVRLFNQNLFKEEIETSEEVDEEVLGNVQSEIDNFQKRLKSEERIRKRDMLKDANQIFDVYLKLLSLPIEIEHREKLDSEKKRAQGPFPFIDHPIIQGLKDSEEFQTALQKNTISWANELNEVKDWYRQEIIKSDALSTFYEPEVSESLVLELYKKVIFKNENIESYLSNAYLHWSENKPILKSMVLKTIKSMTEDDTFEFAELTKNGKEDFDFFEKIFDGVLRENDLMDKLIASKTMNWDVDRIALTDRVILKVALSEMMNAPSIPTKVSINEAIEIAKQYSTPKSKQFINGVLDVLSNELTSMGKIRKTGRGLIDNK